ncbi:glycosyltransferase family 31 protein [Hygrophoropsis aurantiaca]|uniref:Glycosyltransferase family 31 protein n=1 Tax=Hygrophoropsis aurantiaca TaxID=72124 RepID=A0ACB8ATG5_9AGAM|nr:glycosyltransferase family 31 protein [Hygrophoropsis aurantiaca]
MPIMGLFGSSKQPAGPSKSEEYEFLPSAESDEAEREPKAIETSALRHPSFMGHSYPEGISERSSSESSASSSTPVPSRAPSPGPLFTPSRSSSSPSEGDGEPNSPLLGNVGRYTSHRNIGRRWWNLGTEPHRRRRRDARLPWAIKKGLRRVVRHPFFPRQPLTIIFALLCFTVFAISLTLFLMYILNPDKEPLPWRAYCSIPPPTTLSPHLRAAPLYPYIDPISEPEPQSFPPDDLDSLPPAGVFLGVFSMDSGFERRMLIRTTWAGHPRSRNGAGAGDDGKGTSRTLVRFILGQPRKGWERRIQTEMEMYNDIVILPSPENMNSGKTHAYFTWAASNAWVPPLYFDTSSSLNVSYTDQTSPPPPLAPHDSHFAWKERASGHPKAWVRPDYIAKVDDDAFVMLAELEARMRVELHAKGQVPYGTPESLTGFSQLRMDISKGNITGSIDSNDAPATSSSLRKRDTQDPLVYWGYLVKSRFMAGELYGLSWSLVNWVSTDPVVKTLTKGAEDKQTAKWMRLHPRANEIRWATDRCWIYDHPRSGTVYSHGFLFPSEVSRVKRAFLSALQKASQDALGDTPSPATIGQNIPSSSSWAYSSVSTFGVRYTEPVQAMTLAESVEALVEGSDMSKFHEGNALSLQHIWEHREGRISRYKNKRVGGTIVVHFIKKHMWFLETALAFLESDDYSESEKSQVSRPDHVGLSAVWTDTSVFKSNSTL